MEFIKLIIFLSLGYIIKQLNLLLCISILWSINFLVGLYLNKHYFETSNTILSLLVLKMIYFMEYLYHGIIITTNKTKDTNIGATFFESVETIDKYYLEGRKYIFNNLKKHILPPIMNLPTPMMNLPTPMMNLHANRMMFPLAPGAEKGGLTRTKNLRENQKFKDPWVSIAKVQNQTQQSTDTPGDIDDFLDNIIKKTS